jgi:hypothetical protein
MTKLSKTQQAAMWAVTQIEAGAEAFATISRATGKALATRGLFESGTLQLTEAGRGWIDTQIEAAHAEAEGINYMVDQPKRAAEASAYLRAGREQGAQLSAWRRQHAQGPIADHYLIEADHAEAIKLTAPAGWIRKISYRVNDTMTCTEVYDLAEFERVTSGCKVEILREWFANTRTHQIVEMADLKYFIIVDWDLAMDLNDRCPTCGESLREIAAGTLGHAIDEQNPCLV